LYILEAHPTDIWQMQSNIKDKVLFASPHNESERFAVADSCVRRLNIKFPALVDALDDRVEAAYTGWPDRLYLINAGGQVLYKSKAGPFGFDPDDLAAAMRRTVGAP
jgi:hypothetical protein